MLGIIAASLHITHSLVYHVILLVFIMRSICGHVTLYEIERASARCAKIKMSKLL